MSITINKKVKSDGARCPFSTFLRLQGDHHCACAQKLGQFSFFSRAFKQKNIKSLRPKMTKIASRGPALTLLIWVFGHFWLFAHGIEELERHLLWILHKKFKEKNLVKCTNRLRRRTSDQTVLGSNPEVAAALTNWVLGQGSLLPLSQGEAFTLASISYLAILVKCILAKKKNRPSLKFQSHLRYWIYLFYPFDYLHET